MSGSQVATRLEELYDHLSLEPLKETDLETLYQKKLNEVRGTDTVSRMAKAMQRGGTYYKSFLMGHVGVGKTTELKRLSQRIKDQFQSVWLNAQTDINPVAFQPFDVILVMMAEIMEQVAKPIAEGGAGKQPPDSLLKDIWNWFAIETNKVSYEGVMSVEAAAGLDLAGGTLWAKALGLFAKIKGEAKYGVGRKREVVDYRLTQLNELISLANRLLDDCNALLKAASQREWLFVWDNFEKEGFSLSNIERLFVTFANVLKDLHAHMIFTIPISLGYSKVGQVPFQINFLPNTPVFLDNANHSPHIDGRNALKAVLKARVSETLFEDGQMDRLIVASGGDLREMFRLTVEAGDNAMDRSAKASKINQGDVDKAIKKIRPEYRTRLGDDPFETTQIPYHEKAKKLLEIYHRDTKAKVPDAVLHSLLTARAVQEFNGERWFGVHPLVVDILNEQGEIPRLPDGVLPGGSE